MLIALDTNGHVTMVNRKGCEILGYQEGDILRKDWFEHFLPDEVRDEVKGAFSRIISGHLEMDEYLESVVLANRGEARLIAWHNSILRDQDGSIIGTLSSGEDITERKAVEEALRESEERLNYVLEGSSDGFWDWHIESGEVRRNERWAQMLGYSFEDIAFTVPQWADIVHPEDKDKAWRSITDHLEGRTPQHEYEYRMLTKDGAWKWILDRAKVVERDGNGVPIRMAGTHTDITDRKNAEEALRESEEKHRSILASIEEGYYEVDLAGNMTFCNEPLSRMLGYTNEELIGMNNREYMDANNAKQVYEAFNRVYRTGKPEGGFGWKLVRKDGTLRNVEASVSLLKDSEGKPCGFRGVVRDVTERQKMEEALRESEERYRAVFDNAGIGIDLLDRDGRILQVNQSLSDMLGYSEEELRQLTFQDITYPEDTEVSKSKLEALMAGEIDFYRLEKRYLRKDRSVLWADLTTSAIRGPKGEHLGTIGVVSDITDRKKVEGALRESEDLYRTLMTASPDAMFVDVNGSIVYANDSAAKMFDVESPELLIGKSPQDLVHPEELEEVQARIETRYNHRTADSPHEQKFLRSNENVITGEVAAVPTTFQGKPAILVVVRDISERKRFEEFALQSARLKSVADLSSGVAHHFNNLLQIVMASTSLSLADLESGDLSEIKANLEKMLQAATLGAETVKRLQTFANIRADVTEGESNVFDVSTTARNAADVSQPLWKSDTEKKGIKIDLHVDLQDGCPVRGQENEMFEVLVNLIRNAGEALPDGGDIEVKAYREADEVIVTVRDTGTGITEEDLPKVFQPFWSSKGVGIGKGMGLAVSHGLVKRHGGSISVESKVGVGTTFTIRLPLAQEQARKSEQPSSSATEDHLTILVIDDDVNIASLLERICAKEGHTVFRALSGQEGLAVFNKEPVELVISDLGMPGMNGWDVGKAIRSICQEKGVSKPPFILLTGWGGQELEREKITESGVDAVVAKPIDRATVLATVQEIAARFNIGSRVP